MSTTRRNYNCYPIFQITYRDVITNYLSGKEKENLAWTDTLAHEDLLGGTSVLLVLPMATFLNYKAWAWEREMQMRGQFFIIDRVEKTKWSCLFCTILSAGMKNGDWILKFACYDVLPISHPKYFFAKKLLIIRLMSLFFFYKNINLYSLVFETEYWECPPVISFWIQIFF